MCFRPPNAQKAEKKCPKCQTVNPQEATVCANCGAELPNLPPPPGVSAAAAGAPPPTVASGTPPKAPPVPPRVPPAPPKKPGE
jgi:hypothetical protein